MRFITFYAVLGLVLYSCSKPCTKEYLVGERLEIPIQFNNFNQNEINSIWIYRISHEPNIEIDTIRFVDMVIPYKPTADNVYNLTDKNYSQREYGVYESYLHQCDLVFDWYTGTDTLKNLKVLKSKGETDNKCHQSHKNVRIDLVYFEHKSNVYGKNEIVKLFK